MRTRLHHAPNPVDGNPCYKACNDEHFTITVYLMVVRITKPERHSFKEALRALERLDVIVGCVETLTQDAL